MASNPKHGYSLLLVDHDFYHPTLLRYPISARLRKPGPRGRAAKEKARIGVNPLAKCTSPDRLLLSNHDKGYF